MSYLPVNAGDGNSIFDIAYKFKEMELREMEKVPTTIRENKLNGSDTGSSDFLTKLQELHSMIFHIDKKSDIPITELNSIDRAVKSLNRSFLVQSDVNKYFEEFIKIGESTDVVGYIGSKDEYEVIKVKKFNDKFNKLLIETGGDDKKVWSLLVAIIDVIGSVRENVAGGKPSAKVKVKDLKAAIQVQDMHNRFIIAKLAELGDVMSQDTFEKLSKVNDSIPNLLKSILKMVNELVSQSNSKGEVWGSEYDDKNKRKLDQTIKEIETEFHALENRPSINQYIRIYNQIEEPLRLLVVNVKGMIDNTVSYRGPQQFSLRPLEVISPEKLDEIQQSLDILDNVRYSNVVEIVKSFASKIYPYVDNENLIIDDSLKKLKDDIEGEIITDDEWSRISNTQKKKDGRLLLNRYAGRDNLLKALEIVDELIFDVYTRTLTPEIEKEDREKKYNEEAKGRLKDQSGEFVGAGKRRDAKQYLDPEYYHFINTMPKKRFL